jgi:hypothetical protein
MDAHAVAMIESRYSNVAFLRHPLIERFDLEPQACP